MCLCPAVLENANSCVPGYVEDRKIIFLYNMPYLSPFCAYLCGRHSLIAKNAAETYKCSRVEQEECDRKVDSEKFILSLLL